MPKNVFWFLRKHKKKKPVDCGLGKAIQNMVQITAAVVHKDIDNKCTILTNSQMSRLQEVFHMFDRDKDGHITPNEITEVMAKIGVQLSIDEARSLVNLVDHNQNGELEFKEFSRLLTMKVRETDEDEEIAEAFRIFDKDQDGMISPQEVYQVLRCIGEKVTFNDVLALMKDVDKNGDGQIDIHEFQSLMKPSDSIYNQAPGPQLYKSIDEGDATATPSPSDEIKSITSSSLVDENGEKAE